MRNDLHRIHPEDVEWMKKILSQSCPTCAVPVGEVCKTPSGAPYSDARGSHVSRKRLAGNP